MEEEVAIVNMIESWGTLSKYLRSSLHLALSIFFLQVWNIRVLMNSIIFLLLQSLRDLCFAEYVQVLLRSLLWSPTLFKHANYISYISLLQQSKWQRQLNKSLILTQSLRVMSTVARRAWPLECDIIIHGTQSGRQQGMLVPCPHSFFPHPERPQLTAWFHLHLGRGSLLKYSILGAPFWYTWRFLSWEIIDPVMLTVIIKHHIHSNWWVYTQGTVQSQPLLTD